MRTLTLIAILATSASCLHLQAQIVVGHAPFASTTCHNTMRQGFPGIELVDEHGRKLRIVAQPDGHATAYLFAPGAEVATEACPTATMTSTCQPTRVDGVCAVRGHAELGCADLAGRVEFSGCL